MVDDPLRGRDLLRRGFKASLFWRGMEEQPWSKANWEQRWGRSREQSSVRASAIEQSSHKASGEQGERSKHRYSTALPAYPAWPACHSELGLGRLAVLDIEQLDLQTSSAPSLLPLCSNSHRTPSCTPDISSPTPRERGGRGNSRSSSRNHSSSSSVPVPKVRRNRERPLLPDTHVHQARVPPLDDLHATSAPALPSPI